MGGAPSCLRIAAAKFSRTLPLRDDIVGRIRWGSEVLSERGERATASLLNPSGGTLKGSMTCLCCKERARGVSMVPDNS